MKVLKSALLGRSLRHSISPEVHHAIFEILKRKGMSNYDSIEYAKIECAKEEEFLEALLNGERDGFTGFNVTFPYKHLAAAQGAGCSETVRRILSANTIICSSPGKTISTDGGGFRYALNKSFPSLIYSDFALVILGAGGAARAVIDGLSNLGWRKILVTARSQESALQVSSHYVGAQGLALEHFMRDSGPQFIVQATPVGQRGAETLLEDFQWEQADIAADLVYNPLRTRFLDRAKRSGAKIIGGLGMLIEQAALSQYFWMTGGESHESILGVEEFQLLHASLTKFVTPQWDASDI